MKTKKIAAISLLPLAILGCGEAEKTTDTRNQLNNCGITSVTNEDSGFTFRCGLDKAFNVENIQLSRQQVCDVYYNEIGVPERFSCKELPETIDSFIAKGASLLGEWRCEGLDGFGGYIRGNESRFLLKENSEFEVHLTAKDDTDSVWFLTDSIISGTYMRDDTNKLVLEPNSWESDLITASNLTFKEAPSFMLVKPLHIEISDLTNDNLKGIGRWGGEHSKLLNVTCSKSIG